jgi:hypothetical protein
MIAPSMRIRCFKELDQAESRRSSHETADVESFPNTYTRCNMSGGPPSISNTENQPEVIARYAAQHGTRTSGQMNHFTPLTA